MANGAEEVTAAGTKLEAGLKDSDGGEHPKITNNQHEEHIQTEPERNGVEVHWGFPLSHLYRIGLKFYKGKIIFLLFFLILPFSSFFFLLLLFFFFLFLFLFFLFFLFFLLLHTFWVWEVVYIFIPIVILFSVQTFNRSRCHQCLR